MRIAEIYRISNIADSRNFYISIHLTYTAFLKNYAPEPQ